MPASPPLKSVFWLLSQSLKFVILLLWLFNFPPPLCQLSWHFLTFEAPSHALIKSMIQVK
eukprot:c23242_g1_i1 orf=44-223(+)